MDKNPKLVPVWLWVAVIIIIVALCSSCRGGRSLGKGSAGTVIAPQTPQQINERNRPPLEPLPLPPIVHPPLGPIAPQVKLPPVRSIPTTPATSAEANPVIVNPKPAGELKKFQPTISSTPKLITPSIKNLPTDDKATTPEIAGPLEAAPTAETESFNWVELLLNYLLFIIVTIFIWAVYDTIRRRRNSKENRPTNTKLKKAVKKKKSTLKSKKTKRV